MNKGCVVALIIAGLLAVIGLAVFGMLVGRYNRIVSYDENAERAWANVETVLQRRYDLIPNLVNTVKGYAAHEREILEEVTRLRSRWAEAETPSQKADAAAGMESALSRLMVVVENYPDLKANQNFLALQDELAGTENRISVERRRYNEAVQQYNTYIRRIPNSFIAGMAGFERRTPFEAVAAAAEAPEVQF